MGYIIQLTDAVNGTVCSNCTYASRQLAMDDVEELKRVAGFNAECRVIIRKPTSQERGILK